MGVFGEVILANILLISYASIDNLLNGRAFRFVSYKTYDVNVIESTLSKFAILYYCIMAFFPYILSKPIGYYIKNKISLNEQEKPSVQLKCILFLLVVIFIWYYTWLMIGEGFGTKDMVLGSLANLLPLVFLALFIVAFYLLKLMERDVKIAAQDQMVAQLQQYTVSIEKLYSSVKSFRHDYTNVLSTISIFINEKRYDELENYFNTEILPARTKINDDIYKLSLLGNIKILPLKGIVAYKAIVAQDSDISFIVDIIDEVSSIDLNVVDLSKIVGILLDNAIEESMLCECPYIKFCILMNNESKSIIISNRCRQDLPAINDMFDLGFSTKGANRGIGLPTVREILDQNHNCLLEVKKENDEFIIKIDIYDKR